MIPNCGSSVRGITLMSLDGGGKGEAEFWIGHQTGGPLGSSDDLFTVKMVGDEVQDVMRRDIVALRDILNELLDSDLR